MVAASGDIYYGLWYPIVIAVMTAVLTASVATGLVVMWRSRISYSVKAAALAAGGVIGVTVAKKWSGDWKTTPTTVSKGTKP